MDQKLNRMAPGVRFSQLFEKKNHGSGLRAQGLEFRVYGLGSRRVQGLGLFRVSGSRFEIHNDNFTYKVHCRFQRKSI